MSAPEQTEQYLAPSQYVMPPSEPVERHPDEYAATEAHSQYPATPTHPLAPPPPYSPYWYHGQPGAYPHPRPGNPLGVAALVTGVLWLGPIALVLGILGYRRSRYLTGSGAGLSIAGIVLGGVSTLFWIIALFGISLYMNTGSLSDVVVQHLNSSEVGDCAVFTMDNAGFATTLCTGDHAAEVVGVQQLDTSQFPGTSALSTQAQAVCSAMFADYVGTPAVYSQYTLRFTVPNQASWALGARQIVCYATNEGGTALPTGSIRGTAM
ncbi:MAG: septum formation family protein [Promicromonosporaceae bacterium]|nr:septum formation family protein [Promicromonosporaceae bacterium]